MLEKNSKEILKKNLKSLRKLKTRRRELGERDEKTLIIPNGYTH